MALVMNSRSYLLPLVFLASSACTHDQSAPSCFHKDSGGNCVAQPSNNSNDDDDDTGNDDDDTGNDATGDGETSSTTGPG